MIFDPKQTDPATMYKLLIGSVVPRPIAWVSTTGKNGKTNLAPFSFFTVASSNPPVLCFAPALKPVTEGDPPQAVPKDTLRNIKETKEFVVNIVSHALAEKMVQTSGDYPPEASEFDIVGITSAPAQVVKPLRVKESLVNIECTLRQVIEFGDHPGAGNLVLGDIVLIHVDDSIYKGTHIDLAGLDAVGRLSGDFYCTTKDLFQLKRPLV